MNLRSSERGVALLVAMILTVILAGMALSFLVITHSQTRHQGVAMRLERAFETAESGITRAQHDINAGTVVLAPGPDPRYEYGTVSGSLGADSPFSVSVTYDTLEDSYALLSTGSFMDQTRVIEMGLAGRTASPFQLGLFSKVALMGSGTVDSDSYDSRVAPYSAEERTVTFPDGSTDTVTYDRAHGDIGSNGDLTLVGSPTIMGSALSGPDGVYDGSDSGQVFGHEGEEDDEVDLPTPVIAVTDAGGGAKTGNVTIGADYARTDAIPAGNVFAALTPPRRSNTRTLATGNYYATSAAFRGGETLRITGDVVLYLDGLMTFGGGSDLQIAEGASLTIYQSAGSIALNGTVTNGNVATMDASTLMLYSSGTSVSFNGGGAMATMNMIGALYAPEASLALNSANLFGSFVAKMIDNRGNSFFHYDEALGRLGGYGTPLYVMTYWLLRS